MSLAFVLLGCAAPYPDAEAPSASQRHAIEATISSWRDLSAGCVSDALDLQVLPASLVDTKRYCGQAAWGCLDSGVIIFDQAAIGTDAELIVVSHETVHALSDCVTGSYDSVHSRADLWTKANVCLRFSVEGRARILMGIDGCKGSSNPACTCVVD